MRFKPALVLLLACLPCPAADNWQPGKAPLMTRWAKDVSPTKTLPEYPRPQMVRSDWQNLNGLWDYAIADKSASQPSSWDGKLLVPYPIESALSGVMKRVTDNDRIWYRRTFQVPRDWKNKNVLLHFGAVDWETTVTVNGRELGTHRGGYDGFTFDITSALKPSGDQEVVVAVFDPADAGYQPRGKQVRRPNGIWYTPSSGIWQTVWLEPVSKSFYIEGLKIVPDIDRGTVDITANVPLPTNSARVPMITVKSPGDAFQPVSGKAGEPIRISVPKARLWSPDNPFLYDLEVSVLNERKEPWFEDSVRSYFGMRKISMAKDSNGVLRLCLNNKPLFQYGPLDQGFWPDGLYTAPTDEALRYDIEMTKRLGFNMARKHVKVEPDRWYFWCDKLGLIVWQDMPSGDVGDNRTDNIRPGREDAAKQFETELRAIIAERFNHPSIVMWVPFNEGWGQHETPRYTALVKSLDPSRLVNNASGWTDRECGDVADLHHYPNPGVPKLDGKRAGVLGEFGGLGMPVTNHLWFADRNWGYRTYQSSAELTTAYVGLMKRLRSLTGADGLTAAVYTQTTDVEGEVNGLMTYDRAQLKMNRSTITAANKSVYTPSTSPVYKWPVPAADRAPATWNFTTNSPADNWAKSTFNDSAWQQGKSGFGSRGVPGGIVNTPWTTGDIWLRREVEMPVSANLKNIQLWIHHDEDAEVYINGVLAARLPGFISDYSDEPLTKEGRAALKIGKNLIAVHCHQTTGGQYIDVGFVEEIQE